ncbi:MAG TPA: aldehyde dehydrogenase family protein, partial [Casimicrobiaceae bacterium]|nr:aldehyde dehydrogenase family protein [Casimicrobiaceae bacterium]
MPATPLPIVNPAPGNVILRLVADGPREVAQRYAAARAAQPAWAATPIRKRIATIERFREQVIARAEMLAETLTQEVGKPIRQSRNELKGLVARLDFFIAESARALREEKVHAEASLDERITHEPLGVIANISAWNYP